MSKYRSRLEESDNFGVMIDNMSALEAKLRAEMKLNAPKALNTARQALRQLRVWQQSHPPSDPGDEILLEVAIESFEELISDAGGVLEAAVPNMRRLMALIEA